MRFEKSAEDWAELNEQFEKDGGVLAYSPRHVARMKAARERRRAAFLKAQAELDEQRRRDEEADSGGHE